MNRYEELGFFDFEDFVEELNEEELFSVNGGACGAGSSYSPTPYYGGSCAGGGAVTPSYPSSCGGGYTPPSTPLACGGGMPPSAPDPIKYKSESSSKWSPVFIEGVPGVATSSFTTNAGLNKEGKVEVSALANFSAKNCVDTSSFYGSVSLVVDGKVVETKAYSQDTSAAIWDARYDRVGTTTFDYNIYNAKSVQIVSDVDLKITSNGLGNTIVNYSPTTVVLR